MKRQFYLLVFLVLISACSSRQYRGSAHISNAVEQEMQWADNIGYLYQSGNYQEVARKLQVKFDDIENNDISRRYIAMELAELYAYKIVNHDMAKKYFQIANTENNYGASSYINLPRNSQDYNAQFYEDYFVKYRNINNNEVTARLQKVNKAINRLMVQVNQTMPTTSLSNDKQKLKLAIKEFEGYLNQDLTYQQRVKILTRLSLFNLRLDNKKTGISYFERLSKHINDNPLKNNNLKDTLKPINQVELAYLLGKAYLKNNNHLIAKNSFNSAIFIYEVFRNSIHSENQRIEVFANLDVLYAKLIDCLFILNDTAGLISAVERTKARTLVERLNSKSYISTNQQQSIQQIQHLTKKAITTQDNELRSLKSLVKESIQYDNVETIASTPLLGIETTSLLVNQNQNQKSAILVFYTTDDFLISILITPNDITTNKHTLNSGQIENMVSQLYYQNSDGNILFKSDKQVLKNLHSLLINDYREKLKSIRNLVIIPHSSLHSLPFDALFDGQNYLLEHHAISYAPSLTLYKNFLARKFNSKSQNIWAYGNPVYPIQANDLKGAVREVRAIIDRIGTGSYLLGKQASEKHFRSHADTADIIHLATHGKFDAEQPMNSFMLLSSDKEHDGFIMAADFFNIRLTKTRLFVISACETSIDQIKSGDDMFGFTRSLSYAGVGSILSPLWSVNDKSTLYLMKAFYRYLAQNEPLTQALRKAKLDTLKRFKKPSDWAAFKLIGNPFIQI